MPCGHLPTQFQYLADKHAPAAPEIAETLSKLQLPPELKHPALKNVRAVPLVRRATADASYQVALLIRDGKRVAKQLSELVVYQQPEPSKATSGSTAGEEMLSRVEGSGGESITITTSMSTALERDFTVEGRKGSLACPFSTPRPKAEEGNADGPVPANENAWNGVAASDPTPHQSSDPICAAMNEETTSQPAHNTASKCPIRYLDKHSPEEIAQYVSKHKHEIPRSHEVCVSRYQKNEESIRKLDAKYGNLVSMIQGLSQLHRPMMPTTEEHQPHDDVDRASNRRVESWAQEVSASAGEFSPNSDHVTAPIENAEDQQDDGADRQGHFDRPLKEIRVGESPSRPWGISVPVFEPNEHGAEQSPPVSPPPAPVLTSSLHSQQATSKAPGKCPFDHTKFPGMMNGLMSPLPKLDEKSSISGAPPPPVERPFTPEKRDRPPIASQINPQHHHATFINAPETPKHSPVSNVPQMVFTGPVFIGYPMEQAIQFMQHYQGAQ